MAQEKEGAGEEGEDRERREGIISFEKMQGRSERKRKGGKG